MEGRGSGVSVFEWCPGGSPRSLPLGAESSGLIWVDLEETIASAAIAAVSQLDLAHLHPQFIRHLQSNVDPDDPEAPQLIDQFAVEPARELSAGQSVRLLQAVEPVSLQLGAGIGRRWSLAFARVGFLAGPGWLITYRARPWDARFGGTHELPPIDRERLIAAAADFERTDQTALDICSLMLRYLGKRCLIVARELGDEIGNRMIDFHRGLVDGSLSTDQASRIRAELYDLRWAVDAFDRSVRRLTEHGATQAEAWYRATPNGEGSDEAQQLFAKAVAEVQRSRSTLSDAAIWLTNENNSRILDQQAESQRQADLLQRLVGVLSAVVLGPTLVATVFSAEPTWFDGHSGFRAVLLFASMALFALVTWIFVRRLRRAPSETIGPLGSPIWGWAWRLGAQINRRRR